MRSMAVVLELLRKQRSNVEDNFKTLYVRIWEFAGKNYTKKICTNSSPSNIPLQLRKRVLFANSIIYCAYYMLYLDDLCNSLNKHFEIHQKLISSLQCVLPEFCLKKCVFFIWISVCIIHRKLIFKESI